MTDDLISRQAAIRPQLKPFYDPEWEEAERSGEKPQYYKQNSKCGIIFRKYKPTIAKLVMQRTGIILILWKGEDDGE